MAYTNIDDPSAFFQTATYTGNGDSSDDTNAITNDGNSDLKPDFLWIKRRDYDNGHQLADSTRGVTKFLGSETTAAEYTQSGRLASFDTDGFTVQSSSGAFNAENEPFVAWQWKANGGTTASNTDGSTTSTVQANTDAGFSIVTYTGTGSAATIGHGLGVAPAMLIVKNRTTAVDWAVYHKDLTDAGYVLALNSADAQADSGTNRWNDTDPTSSVFSVGSGQQTNQNTNNMICYAFAEKQGYSKFGKYVGNSNANGPFVYLGFKPAFIMWKRTSGTSDWVIWDNKRDPDNAVLKALYPSVADAESTSSDGTGTSIDILSNGFKMRTNNAVMNGSGEDYIYMAFAESSFVSSQGIPTTAR
jgi:hypothetical protein